MKSKTLHLILIVLLFVGMAGCSKEIDPETIAAPPTGGGELHMVSSSSFTDQWGWYYVVGEIQNTTGNPYTSIQLGVEVRDASGASLLKGSDGTTVETQIFNPLVSTISAGEYAPFKFSFDPEGNTPATFNVSIVGYTMGMADRAEIAVENVELINDGSGWFYLSGELVNTSDGWADVHGLAGAGLNGNNQVMSADWSATYTTQLAPGGDANGRDRTPFSIQFPVPEGIEVTQWAIYKDADLAEAPEESGLQVNLTNSYMDDWDSFHIVGTVNNSSDVSLHTLVVAGLYTEDGITLDATWAFIPVVIEPGASVPFDISSFSSVNWNAKQASRVSTYTVQFDPLSTYIPTWEYVTLATSEDSVRMDGATWTFNGTIVNTSGKALSGASVIVSIYDPQNKLVGSTATYVNPEGESIASGESVSYEAIIYFDPSVDSSGYTYKTFVQGDVK